MVNEEMRKVFENFAKEESGHKAKLEALKSGKPVVLARKQPGLKIADYVVDVGPDPDPDMDYRDAIVLAMQKEEAAFRLYIDLAKEIENSEQREVFLLLAQEEARHKLRFEVEYDELQSRD